MKERKSERNSVNKRQNLEKLFYTESSSESEEEKEIKVLKRSRTETTKTSDTATNTDTNTDTKKRLLRPRFSNLKNQTKPISSRDTQRPLHSQQPPQTSLQIRLKMPKTSTEHYRNQIINLPKDMDPELVCPICLKIVIGDLEDLNEHVDECISVPSSSNTNSSISGIVTTNIPELKIPLKRSCSLINIDEDDISYGKFQYTESDIEMIIKSDQRLQNNPVQKLKQKTEDQDETKNSLLIQSILSSPILNPDFHTLQKALRSILDRISVAPKCAVCWDVLKMPAVTSVNCWHVCCEGCWLRTLGTKRLCPHCSAITNPSDLRKVFF